MQHYFLIIDPELVHVICSLIHDFNNKKNLVLENSLSTNKGVLCEATIQPESMFIKDVLANCYCASLLCTKFTCHIMHKALALSSKNEQ